MVHQVGCVFTVCEKCQLIAQLFRHGFAQAGSPGELCLCTLCYSACRHGSALAGSPGGLIVSLQYVGRVS